MAKKILQVQNLNKIFKNKWGYVKAIDDVSFDVHEGEVVGLIGESGSGKTTIGRALIRLITGYSGFVQLENKVVSGRKLSKNSNRFLRNNMQMIFQDPHASLNPQKNVFSILEEPLRVNGIIKKDLKALLKDKEIIRSNFEQTFSLVMLDLELETSKNYLREIKNKNKDIDQHFRKININDYEKPLECFDVINHAYWTPFFNVQAHKINQINQRTEELINRYKIEQANYFSGKIDIDEKQLKEAKEEYELGVLKSKMSEASAESTLKLPDAKKEYKYSKYLKASSKRTTKLLLDTLIDEYRFKYKRSYDNSYNGSTEKEYQYLKSVGKSAWTICRVLKRNKKLINHIDKDIMVELNLFSEELVKKYLTKPEETERKLQEKINVIIEISFDAEKVFDRRIAKAKTKINKIAAKIDKKSIPAITEDELALLRAKLEKAQNINQKEIEKFKKKSMVKIKEIQKDLNDVKEQIKDAENILEHQLYARYNASYSELELKVASYIAANIESIKNKALKTETKKLTRNDKNQIREYKQLMYKIKTKLKLQLETKEAFAIDEKQANKDLKFAEILIGKRSDVLEKIKIKKLMVRQKVFKTLKEVGLNREHAYRYPHAFSGGQRQRVAIGRALISDPKVIIADEPIASLDISIQAQIVNLLKDLARNRGIGIIFIAHDLSMVEYIADKTIILHLGSVVEEGKKSLYKNPIHPYTKNLFEAIPKLSNANKKFEISDFSIDYRKKYSVINKPTLEEVAKDHRVLGTPTQIKSWSKK